MQRGDDLDEDAKTQGAKTQDAKTQGKFIGYVERLDGWRASFRTLKPGEVFSQEGETKMFATEPEAVKWLHTQASNLGFTAIDIRRKSGD